MNIPIAALAAALPLAAVLLLCARGRLGQTGPARRRAAFLCLLCLVFCTAALSAVPAAAAPAESAADTGETGETGVGEAGVGAGMGYLAAARATGVAAIGAGIAVAAAAPAAIGAFSEDPKAFGKALIFVALGEGVALYGLLISILILNKI
jgi:V/A-type H+-transporting ATPase subunit K